jgi:hypothetical protein
VPASVDYRQSARRFGMSPWANLGSCSFCIHSAFRAAFISWVLASSGLAIPIPSPVLTCIVGITCAFTVLWSAHLLAHDRIFPRAEANHACYQECYANHASCRTDAGCS